LNWAHLNLMDESTLRHGFMSCAFLLSPTIAHPQHAIAMPPRFIKISALGRGGAQAKSSASS
jgi:hypothetical protein